MINKFVELQINDNDQHSVLLLSKLFTSGEEAGKWAERNISPITFPHAILRVFRNGGRKQRRKLIYAEKLP